MASIAKVAIVSSLPQLNRLFDYVIPEELEQTVVFGVRVRVRFGRSTKLLDGFVTSVTSRSDFPGKLSNIAEVVSPHPVLTNEILELCWDIAERSVANLGEVLKLAIPAHMPRSYQSFHKRINQTSSLPPKDVSDQAFPIQRGDRVAILAEPRVRKLSDASRALPAWAVQFASLARQVLAREESVLILVPDFREQEIMLEVLSKLGMSDFTLDFSQEQAKSKRYESFLMLLNQQARVVVGSRSAALAPVHNLGAILVWDEADPSYTDQGAPYLNAREIVLVRAQKSGCALVFSSHSRSTDIQRLVEMDYLKEADANFVLPKVAVSEQGFRIDSLAFSTIKTGLSKGPVLVQVASKGQSTALYCSNCESAACCSTCGGPLWRDGSGKLRCRWCNSFQLNFVCACGETALNSGRAGSTRTAAELGKAFPNVRVIEATGDNRITSVAAERTLVVSTAGAEPYSDGGYSAVVILDAQVMLSRQTLRSQEIAIRQWSNAIAKLGPDGTAVVSGMTGKLGQGLALWQQRELASGELASRRELGLPPAVRLGSLHGEQEVLRAIKAELPESDYLVLLGPAPIAESGVESWRLIFKYPYAQAIPVANLIGATVARASIGQVSVSKSGRGKRSVQIRMSDAEVI